ncbi:hypothetical protein FHS83_002592 [Rhizomicrobium palustre]|uniref:Uncharacterized protein n=1 Tax=Rhizomicrobium palustre TaxID=189966 RepID=A0A846N015_9PROT|nr:hypothetical protein [Rhizomicrobium palustre]NIK89274.1 hypothetical protein [Rhizomicrobium palustre]
MAAGNWTWLELAKLLAQSFTPIALVILGLFVQRALKRFEHKQWRNQKLIERKLQVYDKLAPLFNTLLCYYTFVGTWKEHSPADIIKLKREIDGLVHLNKPLFEKEFSEAAEAFEAICFEMYTGMGKDARLRTFRNDHNEGYRGAWEASWDECYSNDPVDPPLVRIAYDRVIAAMVDEIRGPDQRPAASPHPKTLWRFRPPRKGEVKVPT